MKQKTSLVNRPIYNVPKDPLLCGPVTLNPYRTLTYSLCLCLLHWHAPQRHESCDQHRRIKLFPTEEPFIQRKRPHWNIWSLPGNYSVSTLVMSNYHYAEIILRNLVTHNFLYNIYDHE